MKKVIDKTVNLNLVGITQIGFVIMGLFQQQAREESWSQEEIDTVLKEAKGGNYDHLLATIKSHCEPKDESHDD